MCLGGGLILPLRSPALLMDFFRKYYNQQQYLSFQKLICALKTCFWGPLGSGKLMETNTLEGDFIGGEMKLPLSSDFFSFAINFSDSFISCGKLLLSRSRYSQVFSDFQLLYTRARRLNVHALDMDARSSRTEFMARRGPPRSSTAV